MTRVRRRSIWLVRGMQAAILIALLALVGGLFVHALDELRARGIQAGFDFLSQPAGFEIGEGPILSGASEPLWRAFLAGFANTIRVTIPALLLTSVLGVAIGLGRVIPYRLLNILCACYVELVRNVPLLVQLLMWYFVLTHYLPSSDDPYSLGDSVFVSKGGVFFPWPVGSDESWWPVALEWPERGTFNVSGGAALTPEFLSVSVALVVYTAAFVAEAVRAGLQAVPRGQVQAAQSLGLRPLQQMRWVIFPQALRVMVPSITNQYLNLIKNSTLGVAVGYPELVSVSNTTLNQTGRAFECITILISVYLSLSLLISVFMNLYNAKVALRGMAPT